MISSSDTVTLTLEHVQLALREAIRIIVGEPDEDALAALKELEQSGGYGLLASNAAYGALERSDPHTIVVALRDFLVPMVDDQVVAAEPDIMFAVRTLIAVADRQPTTEEAEWMWDATKPSNIYECLRFAAHAALVANDYAQFSMQVGNNVMVVTTHLVRERGEAGARALVAALNAIGVARLR